MQAVRKAVLRQRFMETVLNAFNCIGDNSGCHQIPERCFTVHGYTFPICARCTGVALSIPFALIYGAKRGFSRRLLLLLIPMGMDWGLTKTGMTKGNNGRRLFTGFLGGFAVCVTEISIIKALGKLFT